MSADVIATHKRYREEVRILDSWIPGAGVQNSFEANEERKKQERLLKTSMLFLQLEGQVRAEMLRRKLKEESDREISFEIARKNPLAWPEPNSEAATDVSSTCCSPDSECTPPPKRLRNDMTHILALRKGPQLPAPLTEAVICAAACELPQGPLASFESCLRCWGLGRLGPSELVATARSFAAASPALRRLFTETDATAAVGALTVGVSELATPEQMRELAYLAAAAAATSAAAPRPITA